VPLTLVTGPANAEKARVVLDGYRAALRRGDDPILVVPTFADVERYRAELAAGGVVFGARVVRFAWLVEEAARRAGVPGRPLGRLARERVAGAAIERTQLRVLAGSAATGGFARELLRLVDELEELRVTPQRLTQALRAWAGEDPGRAGYGNEVAALYGVYRRALGRLGKLDAPLYGAAALDALRERPAMWGQTPVFFYGFDDLTALQRDAVQTLAATGAEVTLSLAFEPGRPAFAGRATTFAELHGPDVRHVVLRPRAEHYAPASRAALHHLERRLFEPADGRLFDPDPVDPGDAVTLLQGGGERAELELVAAEAARLIAEEGMAPEEIAVVLRRPHEAAALVTEVFAAFGVEVALARDVAFGHTALGRGLVALLRCAREDAVADDLLAWLRTPGVLQRPELADRLEARARQEGARTAAAARALWEAEHWRLDAIDRVREAERRGGGELLARAGVELAALFAAPRRRAAEVLRGPAAQDGAVLRAGRRALDELAAIVAADRALAPSCAALATLLAGLEVPIGERPGPGRVTVTDPLSLRARRVRALFCCALQEGVFPAAPRAEPFFGDAERDAIAAASGLRLRRRDDLGAERYLFYATVSRPEERLYLCWHEAGDDGEQTVPSFLISDVCDLFGPQLTERRRMRTLGAVGWPVAPTERERLRAEAIAGPRHREAPIAPLRDPALLAELAARPTWSASAIELWAGCPVKWFVERRLDPEGLEPDPELMLRGALAHTVLEVTLRGLREQTGSARVRPDTLAFAQELAIAALQRAVASGGFVISRDPRRQRALAHRLRADLLRYLAHAAVDGTALEPARLEVEFGNGDGSLPALELADGVRIGGRIDRIDTNVDGEAIVYDYKGRNVKESAGWRKERRYQIALYILAARDVLGLQPVGGLYQPLGGKDQRARGLVLSDADPGLDAVRTDRRERADFDALVDGVIEDVMSAVAELRSGALQPRPHSCKWDKSGCAYPTICRCEAA
jgi:ATP-dependent helicase/DNAse subunit B